jgi:hypothetical protein
VLVDGAIVVDHPKPRELYSAAGGYHASASRGGLRIVVPRLASRWSP